MNSRRRKALRGIALLGLGVLLPLLPGPLRAQDLPGTGDAPWIVLTASTTTQGSRVTFNYRGQTSLPDGAILTVSLMLRGEPADLGATPRVQGGGFVAALSTEARIFPGYYVAETMFTPWRQPPQIAAVVQQATPLTARCPLAFGTPREIAAVRDRFLDYYSSETDRIEKEYVAVRDTYKELLKSYDPAMAPQRWKDRHGGLAAQISSWDDRRAELVSGYLMPFFPTMHQWLGEGYGFLRSAFDDLYTGLTIEITEMMNRKGMDRSFFLRKADRKVFGYLRSMRAQILLAKEAELRDRLLYHVGRLFWLHDNSAETFRVARKMDRTAVAEPWKKFVGDWRAQLTELEPQLKEYRSTSFEEHFPDILGVIVQAPPALRRCWDLYDRAILEGTEDIDAIVGAEQQCFACTVPIMEILGFNREINDRNLEPADVEVDKDRDLLGTGVPSGQADASDMATAKRQTANAEGYLERKVAALRDADARRREEILRVFVNFKTMAKGVLQRHLGDIEAPVRVTCAAALAMCQDASGRTVLADFLRGNGDDALRATAAGALGALGEPEMGTLLMEKLRGDASPQVRAACASALGQMQGLAQVETLIGALDDSEEGVRIAVVDALGRITGKKAPYVDSPSAATRRSKVDAVRQWWDRIRESVAAEKSGS